MANEQLQLTKSLNLLQQKFAERYVVHLNATLAAKEAGCVGKNLAQIGFQLVRVPKIAEYIQYLKRQQLASFGLTAERVLQEVARLAFFDPSNMYDEHGCLKNIKDMDEDTRRAIMSIETDEIFEQDPDNPRKKKYVGDKKKLKAADKNKALEMLMKHFGQFGEHNSQKGDTTNVQINAEQIAVISKGLDEKY